MAQHHVMRLSPRSFLGRATRPSSRPQASVGPSGGSEDATSPEDDRKARRNASISRMKVGEIKAELMARGLPTEGRRKELLEALQNAIDGEEKRTEEKREARRAERVRTQQKWGLWQQYEKRKGVVSSRERTHKITSNQGKSNRKSRSESTGSRGASSGNKSQEHAHGWEKEPKWYFLLVRSSRENMIANKVLPELFEEIDGLEREEAVGRAVEGLIAPEEIEEARQQVLENWTPREMKVINATRKVVSESRSTGKVMARRERVLPNYVLLYCVLDEVVMKHITSKGIYKGIYGFANETMAISSDGLKIPRPVTDEDLAKTLQQCDLETEVELFEAKRLNLFPEKENGNGGSSSVSEPEEVSFSPYRIGHEIRSGDLLDVIDGPFKGFSGSVKEVLEDEGKILAELIIFGQETEAVLEEQHVHIVRD